MKVAYASTKANLEHLKKRSDSIVGEITEGMTFKSEAERERIAKSSKEYKAFLDELKETNRAFTELDMEKEGIKMQVDFLRSSMSVEKEIYNRH